jgi:outer membrane protein assembly factor BamD
MKILRLLFIILLSYFLVSCTSSNKNKKTENIKEKDIELQMIDSYQKAIDAYEDGDLLFAINNFNDAEILFPQSKWAPRSALMAAYCYYELAYYSDAIFELERFLEIYPKDKNLPYAYYLLAMSNFENITSEKKDLKPIRDSKKFFRIIINRYPNTDFAIDSKYKIELINTILASKEMYIGRYYLSKEKWIPAINRFKVVLQNYDTTEYTAEALHRLVEVHYKIGMPEEAKKYAKVLGYNYQSSEWYQESYKVFNKKYSRVNIDNNKKKKNSIIKRFKSLFE